MSTLYPTSNILNKTLRTYLLFLCTLYSFSEGNTQTCITASDGVQSGTSKWVAAETGFVKNNSDIDTMDISREVRVFDIKKAGSDKVLLSWTGNSETNLNYYTVERSRDGVSYEEKAIFWGNLNSDSNQHYSFIDKGLAKGSYFYRLKTVNNDGSYRLCATDIVNFNDENKQLQLVIFPNPSGNEIKVTLPDSWLLEKVTFEFYNASGQLVAKQTNSSAGKTKILNIATLPAGVYVVKASGANENAAIGRIIKR